MAGLWWLMFAIASVVCAVIVGMVVWGALRRNRPGFDPDAEPRWSMRLVLFGGVVVPVVILTGLWILSLQTMRALARPPEPAALTIDVVGHRWWWEVRYPEQGIVTANEIHVPVGRPVRVRLRSVDVQHSFWVPQLAPKTDLYPGRTNTMWLRADRPGVYRGQCAEFCGVQHALMIFFIVADQPVEFDRWAAMERQPVAEPTDPTLQRGLEVFTSNACVSCHTIRGTDAKGVIGPDLTHVGSRMRIGAGAVPNTIGYLAGWIADSQEIKPGNLMPPVPLGPADLQAVVAFLESLK